MTHARAVLLSFIGTLMPFVASASGGRQKDFSFLWESPIWSMSAMTLILLWIALMILSEDKGNSPKAKPKSGQLDHQPEVTPLVSPVQEYVVKRGDSLASIAKQFDTTREDIIASNNMRAPFKMKLGQKIKVSQPGALPTHHMPMRTTVFDIKSKKEMTLPWSPDDSSRTMRSFHKPMSGAWMVWFKALIGLVTVMVVILFGLLLWVNKSYHGNFTFDGKPPVQSENADVPEETAFPPSMGGEDVLSTTTPTVTSEQTSPALEPKTTPITILNGSGVRGVAGKLADEMRKDSFEVGETGNAERFDYASTEVRFGSDQAIWANVIVGWLRLKGYTVTLVEQAGLEQVIVIIGKT